MAEISSAGINNYVSQQTAQHTSQQAAQAGESDAAQRSKENRKSDTSQRGVIVQISKEGRDMAKAARAADDTQIAVNSNRTHKDIQTTIVNPKQRQTELQETTKQSDAILANQQNRDFFTKDVMAA